MSEFDQDRAGSAASVSSTKGRAALLYYTGKSRKVRKTLGKYAKSQMFYCSLFPL